MYYFCRYSDCIISSSRYLASERIQRSIKEALAVIQVGIERLATVPLLDARLLGRDCPDNPEGTTYKEGQHGTPECYQRCDQVAGEAEYPMNFDNRMW